MKMYFLLLAIPVAFLNCYSVKKAVQKSYPLSRQINWPEAYTPEDSKFFVHNEIVIKATPESVWDVLIYAGAWESYYEGASNLRLDHNHTGILNERSVFTWKTMGLAFTSTIREFDPPYRLSWESVSKSIRGYHAWLIIPTENGCKLITSEAQHGFMTFPQKVFVPHKLANLHDVWLVQIKNKSESVN